MKSFHYKIGARLIAQCLHHCYIMVSIAPQPRSQRNIPSFLPPQHLQRQHPMLRQIPTSLRSQLDRRTCEHSGDIDASGFRG